MKKQTAAAIAGSILLALPAQANQINIQCTDEKGEYYISATKEKGTPDKPLKAYFSINLNLLTATGAGLSWTVQSQPETIILSSGSLSADGRSQTYRIDRKTLNFSRLELSRTSQILGLWKLEASGSCEKVSTPKGNLI